MPDEITTWMITGFAINANNGFGMTTQPTPLTVFMKFFIQTKFPYSIVRGEIFALPVTVFNYQNSDIVATVVMDNSLNEFDFITNDGSSNYNIQKENLLRKLVLITLFFF